ncbi:MAG TPA: AraC family transcriptional regulator [Allosphingosinicella sp.]|nr:AraC family transcriptional regulator [Allosphingosinicella sp.]
MNVPVRQNGLWSLDLQLSAFGVCEIGRDWRLTVGAIDAVVCHFVLRGSGFIESDGERRPIGPGTIILVPPNSPKHITGDGTIRHQVPAQESCSLYSENLMAFHASDGAPDLLRGCASLSSAYTGHRAILEQLREPLIACVESDQRFTASFDALYQELSRPDVGTAMVADCLMKQILIWYLRESFTGFTDASPLSGTWGDPRLLTAVRAIVSHPEQPHSVASLAALAGMSRSSFAARFADEHKATPMEFVQQVRMQSAARLLRTTRLPIKCLASAVGYASRSQFSRAFKHAYGTDPSSYRLNAIASVAA